MLFVLVLLGACLDRTRLNSSCQWTDTAARALHVTDAADRKHLHEDASIAEELGVRLADSLRGLRSIEERHAVWQACTDSLFALIARTHAVSMTDVQQAPIRRNLLLDVVLVLLPMIVLYWWAVGRLAERVLRRFLPDERTAALVSTFLLSLTVSALWLAVGQQWSWVVEMVRLGNDHISFRAARLPWGHHVVPLCATGVFLFWLRTWQRWPYIKE